MGRNLVGKGFELARIDILEDFQTICIAKDRVSGIQAFSSIPDSCAMYTSSSLDAIIKLLERIYREHPSLIRRKRKVLIWFAVLIVVQAFYMPVRSSERYVIEATDCESGLGIGWGDEAFLCEPLLATMMLIGRGGSAYLSTSSTPTSPSTPSSTILYSISSVPSSHRRSDP